jgi:hypothetical protein
MYGFPLETHERELITNAIKEAVEETGVFKKEPVAPRIIDRDTSVAIAALSADASRAEKEAWDKDMTKRRKLAATLRDKLPGYEVLVGGKTTIDIVRKSWMSTRKICCSSVTHSMKEATTPSSSPPASARTPRAARKRRRN